MNAATIDVDAIVWHPFRCGINSDTALRATDYVSHWLGDFGMDVLQHKPDHWAEIGNSGECYAYRYEDHGNPARHRAVCVIVTLDCDADFDEGRQRDLTKCTRIEIVRCKSQQEERAAVASDPRS